MSTVPITLPEFTSNFKVMIGEVAIPHIDETGTYPAAIGFHVTCLANNRVNFFEDHVTDSNFVNTSPTIDVINFSWSNVKTLVNDWASYVITQPSLIGYTYIPTVQFSGSNINLTTFNANYTVKVSRFEVYPADDPNCWCVGYNIQHNTNHKYMYIDTQVLVNTFAISQDENNILNQSWEQVKENIGNWAQHTMEYSDLINTEFVPISI